MYIYKFFVIWQCLAKQNMQRTEQVVRYFTHRLGRQSL